MGFVYPEITYFYEPPYDAYAVNIFLITLAIAISIACQRESRRNLGLIVFNKLFIFILACVSGSIGVYTDFLPTTFYSEDPKTPAKIMVCVYVPIYLLHFIYNSYTKNRELLATFVFSIFLMGTGLLSGYFMTFRNTQLSPVQLVLLGTVFTNTQPDYMIHFLSLNDSYKRVINFLQGECLMTLAFTFPIVDYALNYINEAKFVWGASLWFFGLSHIIAMFIGWFVAKLIANLMRTLLLNLEAISGIIIGALTLIVALSLVGCLAGFTAGLVYCIVLKNEKHIYLEIFHGHFILILRIVYEIVDNAMFFYTTMLSVIVGFKMEVIGDYFYSYIILVCLRILGIIVVNLFLGKLDRYTVLHIYLHSVVMPTSTFSLMFATLYYYQSNKDYGKYALGHCLFNTGAAMLINNLFGINLMKWTHMGYISATGAENMQHILHVIKEYRDTIVYYRKMDRSMAQVNWTTVNAYVKLSLGYPYPPFRKPIDWEKVEYNTGGSKVQVCCEDCPRLKKPCYEHLYRAELSAQLKVLTNVMKSIVRRMHQHCLLDEECEGILRRTIELYEKDTRVEPISVIHELFVMKPGCKWLKRSIDLLLFKEMQITPRKHFYRLCFDIRGSGMYQILNYVITVAILFPDLIEVMFTKWSEGGFQSLSYVGFGFCIFDFFVNIFAFSSATFVDGLKTYFKSGWHLMEFVSIIGLFFVTLGKITPLTLGRSNIIWTLSYFKYTRILILLHCIPLLLPKNLVSPEYILEIRKITGYQCALAFNDCLNEVQLYSKRHVSDIDRNVHLAMLQMLQKSKEELKTIIVRTQMEKPQQSSSIKTKKTLNAGRCCMNDYLSKLKFGGIIDNFEFANLKTLINYRKTTEDSIPPSNQTLLLQNNYWISATLDASDFFRTKITLQIWPDGHYLVEIAEVVKGIYILVAGHLLITTRMQYRHRQNRFMPNEFENEFISPGNTIGEIELLTGSSYKYTLKCVGECRTYFIDFPMICDALKINNHPIDGLDAALWKRNTMKLAAEILSFQTYYKTYDIWFIEKEIQRAFVPDLRCYKTFVFIDSIKDIVLLSGQVMDYYSQDVYQGPCYIYRTVKRLVLPKPKFLRLPNNDVGYVVSPRLLILPVSEMEPIEVLAQEEAAASMIPHDFAKCPYHVSRTKGKLKTRRHKPTNHKPFTITPSLSAALVGDENMAKHISHRVKQVSLNREKKDTDVEVM